MSRVKQMEQDRHVHKSLKAKSKSSLKSLFYSKLISSSKMYYLNQCFPVPGGTPTVYILDISLI